MKITHMWLHCVILGMSWQFCHILCIWVLNKTYFIPTLHTSRAAPLFARVIDRSLHVLVQWTYFSVTASQEHWPTASVPLILMLSLSWRFSFYVPLVSVSYENVFQIRIFLSILGTFSQDDNLWRYIREDPESILWNVSYYVPVVSES